MAFDSSNQHISLHKYMSSPSSGTHEPMVMGSPSSPTSPVPGHSHSQYLPGFLLGDHTPSSPAIQSQVGMSGRGLWSSSSGNNSTPSGGRLSSGPNINSPLNAPLNGRNLMMERNSRDLLLAGRAKDKATAPPVQGLLDSSVCSSPSIHQQHGGMDAQDTSRHQLAVGLSMPLTPQNYSSSQAHMHHSTPAVGTISNQSMNTSLGIQQSPTQVDPFYSQGEALSPHDILDDTWITIFGFPPAAVSYVLTQFSQYGTVIRHVVSNEGNWMHLHYQSRIQAKKALSKNGKVIGNNIMVGVSPCIDKSVMGINSENIRPINTPTALGASMCDTNSSAKEGQVGTPIRPLTAAYRSAAADSEIIQNKNLPKKNEGMVSKAMEYIFGW